MQKLLVATTNKGKITEISKFLSEMLPSSSNNIQILSLKDVGIDVDVEETGKTYLENSQLKAKFYAKLSGLPAISDDGGLEISALGGAPGVKSRRWLGYAATDEEITEHMKKVAKELPNDNRKAKFITVVSLALPSGEVWSEEESIEGIIAKEPLIKILKGYPYRSFFYLPKLKKYYHEDELTPLQEKEYNHRYKALLKLMPKIKKLSLRI